MTFSLDENGEKLKLPTFRYFKASIKSISFDIKMFHLTNLHLKMKKMLITGMILLCSILKYHVTTAQSFYQRSERAHLKNRFDRGKLSYGVALNLKCQLLRKNLGYMRLSVSGGIGQPIDFNSKHHLVGYFMSEVDFFRGGVGGTSRWFEDQKFIIEWRNTFLFQGGSWIPGSSFRYARPIVQFVSNSAHPLQDPYDWSVSLGTIFVNGINVKRSQRIGILSIGYEAVSFTYHNDGPPFNFWLLPFGDGFDQWWTGSGQIGIYRIAGLQSIEIKYDKFTGLQPYAYELATALRLKHIPYKDQKRQFFNRQRLEIAALTKSGLGLSMSFYDYHRLDIQHRIHFSRLFSYHNTPLRRSWGTGIFYAAPVIDPL